MVVAPHKRSIPSLLDRLEPIFRRHLHVINGEVWQAQTLFEVARHCTAEIDGVTGGLVDFVIVGERFCVLTDADSQFPVRAEIIDRPSDRGR